MKPLLKLLLLPILIPCLTASTSNPLPKGRWLGMELPGKKAKIFAPDFISTGMYERDITISPSGDEIFYRVYDRSGISKLVHTRMVAGVWTEPEVPGFSKDSSYKDMEPAFGPDGKTLYFVSNRPGRNGKNYDIWFTRKKNRKWTEPVNLQGPVNSQNNEFFPSVSKTGRIYFTSTRGTDPAEYIFRATLKDGIFDNVEKLGPNPNSGIARYNASIAPDESFLIIPQYRKDGKRSYEAYFICFRSSEDRWSKPIDMTPYLKIDSQQNHSAFVTNDMKLLFFMGNKKYPIKEVLKERVTYKKLKKLHNSYKNFNPDIYWIEASIIEDIEKKVSW